MVKRKTIILILIALGFVVLGIILLSSHGDPSGAATDSFFVRQRIINLKKGK